MLCCRKLACAVTMFCPAIILFVLACPFCNLHLVVVFHYSGPNGLEIIKLSLFFSPPLPPATGWKQNVPVGAAGTGVGAGKGAL